MTSVRQMVIGPNIVIGGTYWWASRIYKRYGQNNGKKNNCKRIVFLTQENGIEKCAFFCEDQIDSQQKRTLLVNEHNLPLIW